MGGVQKTRALQIVDQESKEYEQKRKIEQAEKKKKLKERKSMEMLEKASEGQRSCGNNCAIY